MSYRLRTDAHEAGCICRLCLQARLDRSRDEVATLRAQLEGARAERDLAEAARDNTLAALRRYVAAQEDVWRALSADRDVLYEIFKGGL